MASRHETGAIGPKSHHHDVIDGPIADQSQATVTHHVGDHGRHHWS